VKSKNINALVLCSPSSSFMACTIISVLHHSKKGNEKRATEKWVKEKWATSKTGNGNLGNHLGKMGNGK